VTTEFKAGSADSARERWATNPVSQISRDYLDFYHNRYPGLKETKPPAMTDDRAANRVVVQESYFLTRDALSKNDLMTEFVFAPERMTRDIPERLDGPRRLPLWVGWPGVMRHRIVVRGAPVEFDLLPDVTLDNPAFQFDYRGSAAPGGAMTLNWDMVTKARSVPPELAEQVVKDRGEVSEMTWFWWDLTVE
jgi:hypothetical protein